jgi:DNA-binding MarR family transcriptional regulator
MKRVGGIYLDVKLNCAMATNRSAVEDEVDRIVAGWSLALPDLDVSPLAVLSRVSRLAHHLERERSVAFARHGLETWSFDVLSALRRAEPEKGLSPGQLLAQTLVTSGTMTNRLNHLEDRGLVRRVPNLEDARSLRILLTEAGRERADRALEDLVEREQRLLADLDLGQREELAELLRVLVIPFELHEQPGVPMTP